ncbi:MAG: Nif3-like dinuclear metal center hexameric protein [bacterium]
MQIKDVIKFIESWAPSGAALKGDNSGLQVGNPSAAVTNMLVCLDVTDRVIEEAVENQVNLILSHHPLLYSPLHQVRTDSWLGRKVEQLIKNDIALYSAHTNLDAARDGVSFALARKLGIENPAFLKAPESRWQKKIAVFVPEDAVDQVRQAMADAGAGIIGAYQHCSYNIKGFGTFYGGEDSDPAVGQKGKFETVEEIRLEMIYPAWVESEVVKAMRQAHPYEEAAYDIYRLENTDVNFGFGAFGEYAAPVALADLFRKVRSELGVKMLHVVEGPAQSVKKIAVCGGSGGALIEDAYRQGAEAYVTGEMKYHTFLEYEGKLTIIVAGHYATEQVILPVWVDKLQSWMGDTSISVIETKILTNPVKCLV